MRKYVVEFIGTFFLVFTIGMCALEPHSAGNLAPVAIGAALMVMIYAGGHISGGHFNPAVTLGVFLRGKFPSSDLAFYIASQVLGAIVAALLVPLAKGAPVSNPMVLGIVPTLLAESLFTFALVWVVLNTATSKDTAGNSNYGLAIGATVMVGAFSVGAVSGAAFNPAVAIGICVLKITSWSGVWIYLVSQFGAAVAAAFAFKFTNPDDL